MARNRFEQVDAPEPDAVTLVLSRRGEDAFGTVVCPAEVAGGSLKEDAVSEELGAVVAFRSAIRLANELKSVVVVVDPDGVWLDQWGTLSREPAGP